MLESGITGETGTTRFVCMTQFVSSGAPVACPCCSPGLPPIPQGTINSPIYHSRLPGRLSRLQIRCVRGGRVSLSKLRHSDTQFGDWLEFYVSALELNVWASSEVLLVERDPQSNEWRVHVRRNGPNATERVFRPVHVVFALGSEVKPYIPDLPGKVRSTPPSSNLCLMGGGELQEIFKGEMVHTSKFKSAEENAGKRVLVVGAGTSGHDIAWDHVNHGAGKCLLERLATNAGSEEYPTTAEVVSGSNMIRIQSLRTEPVLERPCTNETPHTL